MTSIMTQTIRRHYELAISGAPECSQPPQWYAWAVWLGAAGTICVIACLANFAAFTSYYANKSLWGVAIVLAVLMLSRMWSCNMVLLPSRAFWIILIVLLAMLPRLALVLYAPYVPCADFQVYDAAGRLMATDWTLCQGGLYCYYPPGQVFGLGVIYSLFAGQSFTLNLGPLSTTIDDIKAAQLVNVFYAVVTVLALWYISARMFGKYVGRVSALLSALLPSTVFSCMLLGAEAPEAMWFMLALAVYVGAMDEHERIWPALACGILMGVGALIRPQFFLLPLPIGLHMFFSWAGKRRALTAALLMMLATAAVVAPWTYRNYKVTGGLVLISSNNGHNIYSANSQEANGGYNDKATTRLFQAVKETAASAPAGQTRQEDLLLQQIGNQWAWQWIETHPLEFAKLTVAKFKNLWQNDNEIAWWALTEPKTEYPELPIPKKIQSLAEGGSQGYYLALVIATLVALLRFKTPLMRRRAWMVLPMIAACFTAIHMVFEAQGKYHYMLVPLMCIFAALSIAPAEIIVNAPMSALKITPPAPPPAPIPKGKEIDLDDLIS
jgi:hypothetical protein